VAGLLAEAFDDDAACGFVFDRVVRAEGLRALFLIALRLQAHHGATWVRGDATFSVMPPNAPVVNTFGLIRSGLLRLPLDFDCATMKRLLALERAQQVLMALAAPVAHHFLAMVAVDQPHRRQGLGSCMLREWLEVHPGERVALATTVEDNVRFYERLGFEVVDHAPLVVQRQTFPNWVMIRT
jgi:GNAT superfamily N-acetyltransferase